MQIKLCGVTLPRHVYLNKITDIFAYTHTRRLPPKKGKNGDLKGKTKIGHSNVHLQQTPPS